MFLIFSFSNFHLGVKGNLVLTITNTETTVVINSVPLKYYSINVTIDLQVHLTLKNTQMINELYLQTYTVSSYQESLFL